MSLFDIKESRVKRANKINFMCQTHLLFTRFSLLNEQS